MAGNSGWIKLHRRIREHPLWPSDRRYTPLEAWIDLLLSANHKPATVTLGFIPIKVARGQVLTSQVKLAARWGWHRSTAKNLIEHLKSQKMIDIETSTRTSSGYTLLTIVNYEKYQRVEVQDTDSQTDSDTDMETDNQATAKRQPTMHKQELKNEKKTETTESVKLTPPVLSHSKRKQTRPAPDARVKLFLTWFAEEYEKQHGTPYAVLWAKDGKLIRELPPAFDLLMLKDLAMRFFDSSDQWIRQHGGFTVGVFVSQLNKLASTNGNGHAKPPQVKDLGNGMVEVEGLKMTRENYERKYAARAAS